MSMDKLVAELLTLLRELLAGHERLLGLALARRDAMRSFDIGRLEVLSEQERVQMQLLAVLDRRRMALSPQFRPHIRNAEPAVTEISRRSAEPARSQLLTLAAKIKEVVEKVERNSRINAT